MKPASPSSEPLSLFQRKHKKHPILSLLVSDAKVET
jgi:hypothetical protein